MKKPEDENKDIHFLIYSPDEDGTDETGNKIYLDVIIKEISPALMETELLELIEGFLSGIRSKEYCYSVWREGDLM